MENLEKAVADHRFLKGLDKRFLKKIIPHAAFVTFNAGKLIFRQGEKAAFFYLLTQGRVAVELYSPERGSLLIETLDAGDVLGWSWLVAPYKWRFNAQAIAETRAIAIDGERLRKLCEEDYELGYLVFKRFLDVITARLEAANIQILDLYGLPKGAKA